MPAKLGKDVEGGRDVTIGDVERRSGLYVLGKPGMGKTSSLINLIDHDVQKGHGLFFLDPHGDAISELANDGYLNEADKRQCVAILDPENETHSFGINLLACSDINSLKQRTDTYTRAYSVFYKLWEETWGPWLQLIIQNTLYVFIENQEYTLSEVPLFLTNTAFRRHLVGKMRFNREVSDFWEYEFGEKRERDQQEQVQAALTRVRTLLNHQYVSDIVGQRATTVNLSEIMEKKRVLLVKLSASLAPDIKKFIGAILISELLHAARTRPEGKRHQFCIFVDEFQNFATEDFSTLINEARKFGIATTIAHQERYGQFEENRKVLGATSAAANKLFFQMTVKDAQELAPEFAKRPEETEKRREAELVISPRPVEDIWERGHPNKEIMRIRSDYFWVVDALRRDSQERFIVFDPSRTAPEEGKQIIENLNKSGFIDWDTFRSSKDMIKQGMAYLDKYYYECMHGGSAKTNGDHDQVLGLLLKVIMCWGGAFGYVATMERYISHSNEKVITGKIWDLHSREKQADIAEIERQIERRSQGRGSNAELEDLRQKLEEVKDRAAPSMYIPTVLSIGEFEYWYNYARRLGFSAHDVDQMFEWREKPLDPKETSGLQTLISSMVCGKGGAGDYEKDRSQAIAEAMEPFVQIKIDEWNKASRAEMDKKERELERMRKEEPDVFEKNKRIWLEGFLYQMENNWTVPDEFTLSVKLDHPPLFHAGLSDEVKQGVLETARLARAVRMTDNWSDMRKAREKIIAHARKIIEEAVKKEWDEILRHRAGISHKDKDAASALFPEQFKWAVTQLLHIKEGGKRQERILNERFKWHITQLANFIEACFVKCAELLRAEPIKVPSGKFEEKMKVERTQADMINEMAQELSNLPRFTAYAKVLQETDGVQTVVKE
jgi:hypothetical protein